MDYRTIPQSGIRVSTIAIGSGSIHEANEKQTAEIIDYAQEQGINLIDMAASYPSPWQHYGVALKGRREQFYLQMHLGITFETGEYARNYSLESVKRSFASQLQKTGSDHADIAVFHCVDTPDDFHRLLENGVFEYALNLKRTGVIKNLGFASHTVETANRFIETGAVNVFMFSINAAYDLDPAVHDPYGEDGKKRDGVTVSQERQKLYRECVRRGIGITAMKAYGGGKLLNAETSPFGKAMTVPQCLKYALDRPAALSCMLGIKSRRELEDAVRLYSAAEKELDYSFISRIQPKELMGSCVYCNHCMPCPAGIDIGRTHKFLDLCLAGDKMAKEHYNAMEKNAQDCIQCGVCESRCPFGVQVREKMRDAQKIMM